MGADYMIELECRPKQQLTADGIVAKLKARSQAEAVLEMARANGDRRPPSEITFTTVLMRPQGRTEAEVSVQALLDEAEALTACEAECRRCPARPDAEAFGCKGYVNYPVQAATEQWLMSRLPDTLDGIAGHLLKSAVKDLGWDGSYTANMRAQGDTFFESRTPITRKWGGLFSRFVLTSDQLWQMMFGLGSLQPSHCGMVSLFLGLPSHQEMIGTAPPETTLALIQAEAARLIASGSGTQTATMARFVGAMAVAAALDVSLFIDG